MNPVQLATEGRTPQAIGNYRMGGMTRQASATPAKGGTGSKWIGIAVLAAVIAAVAGVMAYQTLSEPVAETTQAPSAQTGGK